MKMGSNFKGSVFNEQVQEGLISWAKKAKKKAHKRVTSESSSTSSSHGGILPFRRK